MSQPPSLFLADIDPVVLALLERATYTMLVDAQRQLDQAKVAADTTGDDQAAKAEREAYRMLLSAVAMYGAAKSRGQTAAGLRAEREAVEQQAQASAPKGPVAMARSSGRRRKAPPAPT